MNRFAAVGLITTAVVAAISMASCGPAPSNAAAPEAPASAESQSRDINAATQRIMTIAADLESRDAQLAKLESSSESGRTGEDEMAGRDTASTEFVKGPHGDRVLNGPGLAFGSDELTQRDKVLLKGTMSGLRSIRSQIELYRARNRGAWPDFEENGWDDLLSMGISTTAPVNNFSSTDVASRITITRDPDATGADFSPLDVGWVWNGATKKIYAAGIEEN